MLKRDIREREKRETWEKHKRKSRARQNWEIRFRDKRETRKRHGKYTGDTRETWDSQERDKIERKTRLRLVAHICFSFLTNK